MRRKIFRPSRVHFLLQAQLLCSIAVDLSGRLSVSLFIRLLVFIVASASLAVRTQRARVGVDDGVGVGAVVSVVVQLSNGGGRAR